MKQNEVNLKYYPVTKSTDTFYNMDESSEYVKSDTNTYCMIPFGLKQVNPETESRLQRLEEETGITDNGHQVSLWSNKYGLEVVMMVQVVNIIKTVKSRAQCCKKG